MTLGARFFSSLELDKPSNKPIRWSSTDCVFKTPDIIENLELKDSSQKKTYLNTKKFGCGNSIGRGRFSTVYRTHHIKIFTECCVKEYRPLFSKQLLAKKKDIRLRIFFDRMYHPAMIRSFEVFKSENRVARLIEYIPLTLYDNIMFTNFHRETGLSMVEDVIKLITVNVLSALNYLHSHNISHGCLHYKNIFVDNAIVKISDCENNVFMEWSSYKTTPLELLPFVAPELHDVRVRATPASDVWSLGVCMYAMATKQLLFEDTTFERCAKKVQRGLISPPFFLPTHIQTLLSGMLRVKPIERLTVDILSRDPWILSADCAKERLKLHYEQVQRRRNGTSKCDEGYISLLTELLRELTVPGLNPDGTEKRKKIEFTVYLQENNRKANEERVEACLMTNGKLCIKVFIPEIEREEEKPAGPTRMDRLRKLLFRRPLPQQAPATDCQIGDYALMSFGCNGGVIEKTRNYPKFKNRNEAHKYAAKKHAKKLWDSVDIAKCSSCLAAGCDSGSHTLDYCLYRILSNAEQVDELFEQTSVDVAYMKLFKARVRSFPRTPSRCSVIYRTSRQCIRKCFHRQNRRQS
ncbi:hypothetical protein CAEBREN_01257 [Caenorhabditis brenneri]|uniref:Protein kinase domain-containing protein n=1 Tax=Caenorhabditis brenneri TaxID=135651 RepID=G0M748_CAEBE|nr:hypothetical protein CAEBREN_01257 [Caenorhabditis brenneri]